MIVLVRDQALVEVTAGDGDLLEDVKQRGHGRVVHEGALEVRVLRTDGLNELRHKVLEARRVLILGVLRVEQFVHEEILFLLGGVGTELRAGERVGRDDGAVGAVWIVVCCGCVALDEVFRDDALEFVNWASEAGSGEC